MYIKYITEENLEKLRANYKTISKEVLIKGTTNIQTFFNDENIVKNTSIEIDDFTLDISPENKVSSDFENVKRVYSHMKSLSVSKASDERIWVAYSLSEFIDYMKYRWMPDEVGKRADRYFFQSNRKRALFRHGVARLWWIGHTTYDVERTNPYELTEFALKHDQDFINQILDIGFSSNPVISNAVLTALFDAEKAGVIISRDFVREISKYVNLLGGTYIIDCLSNEEIYDKIKNKIGF